MNEFDLEATANSVDFNTPIFSYQDPKSSISSRISIGKVLDGATRNKNISDIHFKVGQLPLIRIGNQIAPYSPNFAAVDENSMETLFLAILTTKQRKQFDETHELNCSLQTSAARFRVNIGKEIDGNYVTIRIIPNNIMLAASLGFPTAAWKEIINLQQGLILVTGVTGSGKSTTLASLIQEINNASAKKIICIEDPIEYVHRGGKSLVIQREVGVHTDSFYQGVKSALRQDPDVILIGEIRDRDTAQAALQAAETGHLVFSTLHTKDSAGTIGRYVDLFPEERKGEVRSSLADVLSYVLCQDLVPYYNKNAERVLVMEVMKNNSAVSNLIREGKTGQIYSAIQTGAQEGMMTMEQCLLNIFRQGRITKDVALQYARRRDYLEKEIGK